MFNVDALTFQEFMMREPVRLSDIHQAVLEFLQEREDAVLFGAQAVNAYVGEPRMTQDIDILSDRAFELAQEMREHLHRQFHMAVRVRKVAKGRGYRVFQVRKSGNRVIWLTYDGLRPCPHQNALPRYESWPRPI